MRQKLTNIFIQSLISSTVGKKKLTIQLCWARDQLVTKGMKECDKLETKIFKPRPQPQNCINISLIWTQLRKLVMYRWTAIQYADIICLPFHYSASLPAYVMCFRVNQPNSTQFEKLVQILNWYFFWILEF